MFITILLTIANTRWKPKCPPKDEWIKMWYVYVCVCIYIYEYYQGIKMNEIVPFTATQMDIDIITLSEVSQKQKSCDIINTYK